VIVIDASIFGKLFLAEDDSASAGALVSHALESGEEMVAPTALLYESLSIALRHGVPFKTVLTLLDHLRAVGLAIGEPSEAELLTAERITTTGHSKTGYPALNDSIFHAMAIERDGVFVTADRRHVAKAKQFGSVVLLADWRPGRRT
jgi:predicted nucleic acid-binding protein